MVLFSPAAYGSSMLTATIPQQLFGEERIVLAGSNFHAQPSDPAVLARLLPDIPARLEEARKKADKQVPNLTHDRIEYETTGCQRN